MRFSPLGDSALVVALGSGLDAGVLLRARSLAAALAQRPLEGVIEAVPVFASVTVFYDPARIAGFAQLCADIEALAARVDVASEAREGKLVEVPVCYGGDFGPDLAAVAAHSGLTVDEVVGLHSGASYLVHAVGFTPGFGYLGGLPEAIRMPRRATPRTGVPAGSVGIGGAQTGVYPLATPGGWNLIGRTPLALFDPARADPALLQAGDRVQFRVIAPEEFQRVEAERNVIRYKEAMPASDGSNVAPYQPIDVTVLDAGMLTTVQDLGRRGHRAAGVPLGGAVDKVALRLANLLVGNPESAAALEFTLRGPELEFSAETIVALTGGDFGGWPRWKPLRVAAGTRLKLGPAGAGCRGYLAIAGGFDVEPVLGGRGTYLRAALGGFHGRALQVGDVLHAPEYSREVIGRWHMDERILPAYSAAPTVRIVRGAQADEFGSALTAEEFKVTPRSDRMGVRLTGPALVRQATGELASAAVAPGTIQVPPDGQPIVLMADAQTIGGYPQVAHVIAVDLPLVAQLRPGDAVRFHEVTLAVAHKLAHDRERALGLLHEGLAQKFR